MNWKSTISIVALLTTGFVIGFIANRYLTKKTARKIAVLRQAKGMENKLYYILELEDVQKEKLAPIIKKHFELFAQFNKESQLKREVMMSDLKEAIAPSLNEAQKERFEKFSKRVKRIPGKRKKIRKKHPTG